MIETFAKLIMCLSIIYSVYLALSYEEEEK